MLDWWFCQSEKPPGQNAIDNWNLSKTGVRIFAANGIEKSRDAVLAFVIVAHASEDVQLPSIPQSPASPYIQGVQARKQSSRLLNVGGLMSRFVWEGSFCGDTS